MIYNYQIARLTAGYGSGVPEADGYASSQFEARLHGGDRPTERALALIEVLRRFTELPDDWNGHGATALSNLMFRRGYAALIGLDHRECWPTKVVASPSDGFGLVWEESDRRIALDVDGDSWEWSVESASGYTYGEYDWAHASDANDAVAAFLRHVRSEG